MDGQEKVERRNSVPVWCFSAIFLAFGVGVALVASTVRPLAEQPFQLPWWLIAGSFVVAERWSVHLDVRREAHTLTFTEVPMTLALFFAAPVELVLARVLASTIALLVFRRPAPVKLLFNAGLFASDVGLSVLVFRWVLGGATPVDPRGWMAALAAVVVAHLVGAFAVSGVMRLAGAPVTVRSQARVIGVSLCSVVGGSAVAVAAASTLWKEGRSWPLLLLVGAGLGYFFVSFVRVRDRHRSLSTLHLFTTGLGGEKDTEGLATAVASGVADLLQASRVLVYVPIDDETSLSAEYLSGEVRSEVVDGIRGNGELFRALRHRSLTTGRPDQDAISAALPLPVRDGLIVVEERLSDSRSFDAEDVQLLETAAGHAASALHNAQLVDRLRKEASVRSHQALHDDITDLPNQRSLIETLDGQLAAGAELVMLTVRTHSLREVNETLGRSVGDEMLRQVAQRLMPIGRRSWCARSGTDEFTLVIPGGQEEADETAQRIVEAFDQPVLCNDVALAVTVGIGVALAPVHGTEAEMLVRRASLAASRSALDGTTVTTWASDRDPYDPHRLTIAADLRDAIPAGELEVHFQPQLDLDSNAVTGVEALVRWRHPRLGQLRPDQFIAAAEHTGAIDALTFHVLTVAAETGARWHQMGWELDVAVNLSARNLTHPNFAGEVANILDVTGFPATSLTLELTESSVMTEAERAMTTLDELHELGVIISIDDFGTGYSSLAHLRRLPVSEIKIDKSFVLDLMTNASDAAIVRSMIELGHNLGLTVVAEGVETVEVRGMLQELRSDRLQGYLLSRPLTSSAFEHWFTERQSSLARAEGKTDDAQVVNLESRR